MPSKHLNSIRTTVRKTQKRSKKQSETCPKNFKPLSCYLKNFTDTSLKLWHCPNFAQKTLKIFVTATICRGGHAKTALATCDLRGAMLLHSGSGIQKHDMPLWPAFSLSTIFLSSLSLSLSHSCCPLSRAVLAVRESYHQ